MLIVLWHLVVLPLLWPKDLVHKLTRSWFTRLLRRFLTTGGRRSTTKQLLAWLHYPLTEGNLARTICRCLRKNQNVDFLLWESDVVVDIPDGDTLKLLEDVTNPGEGVS